MNNTGEKSGNLWERRHTEAEWKVQGLRAEAQGVDTEAALWGEHAENPEGARLGKTRTR